MKTRFIILLLLINHASILWADMVDGLNYNLYPGNMTATVTYIGSAAESKNYTYKNIVIPSKIRSGAEYTVTKIGYSAFHDCKDLMSITIPETVTYIEDLAFEHCTNLKSIEIPNSVTSIRQAAFWCCSGLTSATIPNSISSIGAQTFKNCYSLTSITIPNSISSIDVATFKNCYSLTSITIPDSLISIRDEAFFNCYSLPSITIPNSVNTIGDNAFYDISNVIYSGDAVGAPWGARSVNGFVDGCLVYSDSTKTNLLACPAGTTGGVEISNNTTSIRRKALYKCENISNVKIGNSVINIGDSAFYGCSGITSLTLPESLTHIGQLAFWGCGIKSITCKASTPPEIEDDSFGYNYYGTPLFVPEKSLNLYKEAYGWRHFYNIIPILELPEGVISCDSTITLAKTILDPKDVRDTTKGPVVRVWSYVSHASNAKESNGLVKQSAWLNDTLKATTDILQGYDLQIASIEDAVKVGDLVQLDGTLIKFLDSITKKVVIRIINGTIRKVKEDRTVDDLYTIKFVNWDNTELLVLHNVKGGITPEYNAKTPTRPEDDDYTYTFKGWSPKIVPASSDATYIATYDAISKSEDVDLVHEDVHCTKLLRDGQILILRGDHTYTLTGQEVK